MFIELLNQEVRDLEEKLQTAQKTYKYILSEEGKSEIISLKSDVAKYQSAVTQAENELNTEKTIHDNTIKNLENLQKKFLFC